MIFDLRGDAEGLTKIFLVKALDVFVLSPDTVVSFNEQIVDVFDVSDFSRSCVEVACVRQLHAESLIEYDALVGIDRQFENVGAGRATAWYGDLSIIEANGNLVLRTC